MTTERRAKLVELAEAVTAVNVASHIALLAKYKFGAKPLDQAEAELTAAADRLDKAMVAWFMDRFVNAQIQVCTGGGYVDPNKIESTPTAAMPQE